MLDYYINQNGDLEVILNVPPFLAQNRVRGAFTEEIKWRLLIPAPKRINGILMWEDPKQLEDYENLKPFTLLRMGDNLFGSKDDEIITKLLEGKKVILNKLDTQIIIKLRINY